MKGGAGQRMPRKVLRIMSSHNVVHLARMKLLHFGEAFRPLVLADDPDTFAELEVKKTVCYGPKRNKWLGLFSDACTPDYLTREYPSDYDWDAASLAADPTTFAAYREAAFTHARRAMSGTLGCLTPGLSAKYTGVQFEDPVWFRAGAHIFPEGGLDYLGSSNLVHARSILAIVDCLPLCPDGCL